MDVITLRQAQLNLRLVLGFWALVFFDKTWRFLTWAWDFDLVLDVSFDYNKLKFKIS